MIFANTDMIYYIWQKSENGILYLSGEIIHLATKQMEEMI